MGKKFKPKKEPSLFRKIIDVYYERAQLRKAERTLANQVWSLDYLSKALARAAAMNGQGLSLVIEDRNGRKMRIESGVPEQEPAGILDRLDDDVAIREFIAKNSVR